MMTMMNLKNSNITFFYDTNILLHSNKNIFNQEQKFYISNITLQELEQIKYSIHYDQNIKYKARQISRWLANNQDKYEIAIYKKTFDKNVFFDVDTNDKKIIATVKEIQKKNKNIIFYTFDINCLLLANSENLNTEFYKEKYIPYKGYSKIICKTDEELAIFYEQINSNTLPIKLYLNEYLLVCNNNEQIIDKYKYTKEGYKRVLFNVLQSKMFGKVKPLDPYQELVIDSFKTNQLTVIKGAAGSGKSLLSLAFLFEQLQKNKIDKIIIFCNTVATAGSAKLGYYPGDRTEKLLDSQIGNFLISKLGAKEAIDRLIEQGQLLLLPMSDIRGFDTTGMRAGIYITQAQNLDIPLMKLALQRIGEDSICILDGDNEAQVDLKIYAGDNNGLKRVSQVFKGNTFYGQVTLNKIHRSKIAYIASKM